MRSVLRPDEQVNVRSKCEFERRSEVTRDVKDFCAKLDASCFGLSICSARSGRQLSCGPVHAGISAGGRFFAIKRAKSYMPCA